MTDVSQPNSDFSKRKRQTVSVGRLLQHALTPAARRHGFAETAVLADWASIVGPELAQLCQPIKVARRRGRSQPGTLVVQASPISILELQHSAPQIIDRINTYFGFPAIATMRLQAGRVRRHVVEKLVKFKPLSVDQREFITKTAEQVQAHALRTAVERLGNAVFSRERS